MSFWENNTFKCSIGTFCTFKSYTTYLFSDKLKKKNQPALLSSVRCLSFLHSADMVVPPSDGEYVCCSLSNRTKGRGPGSDGIRTVVLSSCLHQKRISFCQSTSYSSPLSSSLSLCVFVSVHTKDNVNAIVSYNGIAISTLQGDSNVMFIACCSAPKLPHMNSCNS